MQQADYTTPREEKGCNTILQPATCNLQGMAWQVELVEQVEL
jgi:hypothetical protein